MPTPVVYSTTIVGDESTLTRHRSLLQNGRIPSQWGVTDKGRFRQFLGDISGVFPNANAAFQGVSDIVGGKRDPMFPRLPVQQGLMAHYPGLLIIELPGGNDLGKTAVRLSVPSAVGCPQGTSEVP